MHINNYYLSIYFLTQTILMMFSYRQIVGSLNFCQNNLSNYYYLHAAVLEIALPV